MAPSHSKPATENGNKHHAFNEVLLSLVPDEIKPEDLNSTNSVSYQLRSTPSDDNSPKHKVTVRILPATPDTRTIIQWIQDVRRIITGLNIADYAPRVAMVKTLLRGTNAAMFDTQLNQLKELRMQSRITAAAGDQAKQAIRDAGVNHDDNKHADDVDTGILLLAGTVFPRKALQQVKRCLRYSCRKPTDMKVRACVQHLTRVNMEEIPLLPPFQATQSLSNDEMLDILLRGTPRSWQREMDRQGFDVNESTFTQVIDFLENIEASETFDPNSNKKDANKKDGKKKSSSNNNNNNNSSGDKNCLLHGKGSHSTDECRTLQNQAKKLKANYDSGNQDSGKSKNKTWSRKAQDNKDKTQKDLAAFIAQTVADEVAKAAKKRKPDEDESSEDGELLAFEKTLKDFNYEDMENLSLDDKVTNSVDV